MQENWNIVLEWCKKLSDLNGRTWVLEVCVFVLFWCNFLLLQFLPVTFTITLVLIMYISQSICMVICYSCGKGQWLCSHENELCSERHFGSRSKTWLGSWFELRAFTCIANAFPITIRICALRGNILFLLRSPRWLTHAWLQRAFPKCTCTNHVPKELCVHMS